MESRFEQFIRERQFLTNVPPETIGWYRRCLKWLPSELSHKRICGLSSCDAREGQKGDRRKHRTTLHQRIPPLGERLRSEMWCALQPPARPTTEGTDGPVDDRQAIQRSAQFFNPAAFCRYSVTAPSSCLGYGSAGQDGSLERNGYYGPAQRDVDMGLFRTFALFEGVQLKGRAEVTNVFNLGSLGNPNSTLSSATVGQITAQATNFNMRQMQFGLRLKF